MTEGRAFQEAGAELTWQQCLEPHLKLSERERNLPLGLGDPSITLCVALRS